jgi:CPA1 family monovalent cation:H+ antiporter
MDVFEWVIGLMFGAALLSMLARRIGLPYPSLLAVGGAAVAQLPMSPT